MSPPAAPSSEDPMSPDAPPSSTFEVHPSFSEVVDRYDGFILDQFGVMHNGAHALEGAADCVSALSKAGKKLVILSNSSSASAATVRKLPKLGFDPEMFSGAITSGEEAGRHIAETYGGEGKKAAKAVWFTWKAPKVPSPMDFLDLCGGGVVAAESVEDADLVIAHGAEVLRGPGEDGEAEETSLGTFGDDGDMSVIDPVLRRCKERGLPLVCANPDFVMVKPDGTQGHMPGKIAQRYEEMGGEVHYFGKPHVPHFEACLSLLGLDRTRVAHVGDSLHHDVQGANDTGIDSVFVAGGIHREELGAALGEVPEEGKLREAFEKHGQTPTHVVPMLRMD
eukprot:CAMPEP_0183308596 /NCGR_PEP_ID=MMETSP0160_2-20130417/22348_1 /TAXON_ID=2839 ORGANISM="Odontella Sinensis, Strain Grunow 1884" /NCGR_SAMPLE_ID=MMETSP0160_2 /ASSEMBLY_ACC=CAM_ASM_000250 /LENGTH=336 /DNA_ID=CAMNT_0025472457 /DNA_START=84 /DNA_END=1094 /DNA_ORIENTATION=-